MIFLATLFSIGYRTVYVLLFLNCLNCLFGCPATSVSNKTRWCLHLFAVFRSSSRTVCWSWSAKVHTDVEEWWVSTAAFQRRLYNVTALPVASWETLQSNVTDTGTVRRLVSSFDISFVAQRVRGIALYALVYQQQFVKLTACIRLNASPRHICLLYVLMTDWLSVFTNFCNALPVQCRVRRP